MGRNKLNSNLIQDKSSRKPCYKKRSSSLLKKVQELSTLCGVDACAIVYSPIEEKPHTWPQSHEDVMKVFSKIENLDMDDQSRNMTSQEEFVKDNIERSMEQLPRLKQESQEEEINLLIHQLMKGQMAYNRSDLNEINGMYVLTSEKLKQIDDKIEELKNGSTDQIDDRIEELKNGSTDQITEEITDSKEPLVNPEFEKLMKVDDHYINWDDHIGYDFFDRYDDDDAIFRRLRNDDGAGPSSSHD